MKRDVDFVKSWPIVYNIKALSLIPGLKENGKTVYPAELYEKGQWTWSAMEGYLAKIKESGFYNEPFSTNYYYAALMALASNGASVFDGETASFDSPEAIEAVEYLDRLMGSGLMSCSTADSKNSSSGWMTDAIGFLYGDTAFTNCPRCGSMSIK